MASTRSCLANSVITSQGKRNPPSGKVRTDEPSFQPIDCLGVKKSRVWFGRQRQTQLFMQLPVRIEANFGFQILQARRDFLFLSGGLQDVRPGYFRREHNRLPAILGKILASPRGRSPPMAGWGG